jgi:hypothetical protein
MIEECPRLLSGCPVTLIAGENSSAEKIAEDISIPSIKVYSYSYHNYDTTSFLSNRAFCVFSALSSVKYVDFSHKSLSMQALHLQKLMCCNAESCTASSTSRNLY